MSRQLASNFPGAHHYSSAVPVQGFSFMLEVSQWRIIPTQSGQRGAERVGRIGKVKKTKERKGKERILLCKIISVSK